MVHYHGNKLMTHGRVHVNGNCPFLSNSHLFACRDGVSQLAQVCLCIRVGEIEKVCYDKRADLLSWWLALHHARTLQPALLFLSQSVCI